MKTRYRNVAFLVELMINILVFSISCAVLVGLFGKAGQISSQTNEETAAGTEVQTLVETLKLRGPQALGGTAEGDTLTFHYDGDWNQTEDGGDYTIVLTITDETTTAGTLQKIDARAWAGETRELYSLQTAHYTPV